MERLPEFIANHWVLTGLWLFLAIALATTVIRSGGKSLAPALVGGLVNRAGAVVLDIRADTEFRAGHIAGSLHVPYSQLKDRLGDLEKHRGKPLVVVCNLGNTAGDASRLLKQAGHADVYRLAGGITAWRSENLPVVKS